VPYADGEAEVIGLLGPVDTVPSESSDPNRPDLFLEGHELIHFTCHGAAGDRDSAGTALRLVEGEGSSLAAAQILRIDLSAQPVVVLSSCEINHPDLAGLASAYMLDRCLDDAIALGRRAHALAADLGALGARLNADVTLGTALVFAGRMDEGWQLVEAATGTAQEANHELELSREQCLSTASGPGRTRRRVHRHVAALV
jgi:hypothetical protein